MAIAKEKLIVLKAFYMGYSISAKKHCIADATRMIDTAIVSLENADSYGHRLRLLLYILMKAEILRGTNAAIALRARAQELSRNIGGPVFDYFMAVEESTQTRKKVYGLSVGIIADEGVKPTTSYTVSNGFYSWIVRYDAACRAIGVDEGKLTDKEFHFLRKESLKDLIKRHGISCEF